MIHHAKPQPTCYTPNVDPLEATIISRLKPEFYVVDKVYTKDNTTFVSGYCPMSQARVDFARDEYFTIREIMNELDEWGSSQKPFVGSTFYTAYLLKLDKMSMLLGYVLFRDTPYVGPYIIEDDKEADNIMRYAKANNNSLTIRRYPDIKISLVGFPTQAALDNFYEDFKTTLHAQTAKILH